MPRTDRVINLQGGTYNEHVNGNYVQGSQPQERNITNETEVSDGKGKNYVENQGGKKVERWF